MIQSGHKLVKNSTKNLQIQSIENIDKIMPFQTTKPILLYHF